MDIAQQAQIDAAIRATQAAQQQGIQQGIQQGRDSFQVAKMPVNFYTSSPGSVSSPQSKYEGLAGVTPPAFLGMIDQNTGQLLDQYKVNPFAGAASQKLQSEAMSTSPSDWANNQMALQKFNESQAMGNAAQQSQQGQSNALAGLAMNGGLGSGARTSLARQAMRNSMNASQGVGSQGIQQRYDINNQDLQRRQALLGQVADLERGGNLANIDTQKQNLAAKQGFDTNRYNQLMGAWGAEQTANATRNAASQSSGGGGGCCFIFLEARYSNGAMDSVVRKFRDENMTVSNKRGYYKLSEVLIPMMRKSKIIKMMVQTFMTTPLFLYGEWYYGKNKFGWIFSPIKNFWIKTFDYLGQDHEFIRENGELI